MTPRLALSTKFWCDLYPSELGRPHSSFAETTLLLNPTLDRKQPKWLVLLFFLIPVYLDIVKFSVLLMGKGREPSNRVILVLPHFWAERLAELPFEGENPSPKWGNPQAWYAILGTREWREQKSLSLPKPREELKSLEKDPGIYILTNSSSESTVHQSWIFTKNSSPYYGPSIKTKMQLCINNKHLFTFLRKWKLSLRAKEQIIKK